jgi:hypothetical protein
MSTQLELPTQVPLIQVLPTQVQASTQLELPTQVLPTQVQTSTQLELPTQVETPTLNL